MRLPVPIFSKEKIYTEGEVDAPEAGLIASTLNVMEKTRDDYTALLTWISGCIKSLKTQEGDVVEEPARLKQIIRKASYKTAEYATIQSLLQIHDDDEIEGIYNCPRCSEQIIAEKITEDGDVISDTLDYVSQFPVLFMGTTEEDDLPDNYEYDGAELSNEVIHTFEKPPTIKTGKGEVEVVSIEFEYPTIQHCINAFQKTGQRDKSRLQFQIYVEALTKVNGEEVDSKWKNTYGMQIFNKIRGVRGDLSEIFRKGGKYGIDNRVHKTCHNCGKEWKEKVNPMLFFASALQQIA